MCNVAEPRVTAAALRLVAGLLRAERPRSGTQIGRWSRRRTRENSLSAARAAMRVLHLLPHDIRRGHAPGTYHPQHALHGPAEALHCIPSQPAAPRPQMDSKQLTEAVRDLLNAGRAAERFAPTHPARTTAVEEARDRLEAVCRACGPAARLPGALVARLKATVESAAPQAYMETVSAGAVMAALLTCAPRSIAAAQVRGSSSLPEPLVTSTCCGAACHRPGTPAPGGGRLARQRGACVDRARPPASGTHA